MLTLDVEKTGDVTLVRCSGRIVRGEEVRTLRTAVVSGNDTRIVVLDLSDVETLDAGGLTALLSLHYWARNRGVQLKLVNPSHFVNEMLERTQLDRVFDISSLNHALLVLSGGGCKHAACIA
jgi:anti-sigma B factor antagonist